MAQDDGYREIQLNGKQLIFLFMATTIVAVVIFLCGVTVGRGVRNATAVTGAVPAATSPAVDLAAVPTDIQAKPTAPPPAMPPPPTPAESAPSRVAAEGAAAAVSKPAVASEKPALTKASPAPSTAGAAAPSAVPAATGAPKAESAVVGEPSGQGWAVQVGAYNDRPHAEVRARELLAKNYNAFIVAPPATGGAFRVRIGNFKERREADAVLRRLAKEEKIKPFLVPPTR